uniref:Adenylate kinase isoenzyme 6 homolog n=1 Tax=Hirondellea gigas TaxID=1518452 RepID=A0A6A7G9I8_9CRUS
MDVRLPNIMISGTPGTGKSETSRLLVDLLGDRFRHIEVGPLVAEKGLHDGKDDEFDAWLVNDDKIVDELEETVSSGGNFVDFHAVELFPERWFDLVVILRTDNSVLWDRLTKRKYSMKKIQENIEAEIMQVILQEARESYKLEIIVELQSNTIDQLEHNVQWIMNWINQYMKKS